MKKIIKLFFIIFLFMVLLTISTKVEASSIQSIKMDIKIDSKGNAAVEEVWKCNVTEGTEAYHPYYNLGNSTITNFTVTENNLKYTALSTWDIKASMDNKKNKSGINIISNGVELCWGIGSYGTHTYKLNYTITNFVAELNDSQMIYWTLIPYDMSDNIQKAYIKIYSDFDFAQTTDVWGYGNYGGTAYVYDGYIEMESDGALDSSEYMTILVKFPKGTFNTTNLINKDFDYYYDMAQEGSTKYEKKSTEGFDTIIIVILFFVFSIFSIIRRSKFNMNMKIIIDRNWKNNKTIEYFRDIPCKGDIFRAYYIAYNYNIVSKKTDILGAIILKWLKEGIASIEKRETGFLFKKQEDCIILQPGKTFNNNSEQKLYEIIYEASGDGVLESKEFEKWCQRKYTKLLGWFDEVLNFERDELLNQGKIKMEAKRNFLGIDKYYSTPELEEEAYQIEGLKKYLTEYTLIKDREAIEVAVFEEYLIYAQMIGIAKQVAKEFKELYPELMDQCSYNYDDIIIINYWSNMGVQSANSAKSRAEAYSGGGGGFSSGGGRRRIFRWPEVADGGFR